MARINANKFKFLMLIIFIILSFVLAYLYSYYYDAENIKQVLNENPYAWIVYLILVIIATATVFPITVVLVPAIFLFSFTKAVLLGFLGIILGSIFVYYLARYLGRDFVKDYIGREGGRIKAINKLIEEHSFEVLLLLNFVYIFPSNIAHILAGVTHTKFYKFFTAMAVGNFPNFLGIALFTNGIYFYDTYQVGLAITIFVLCNALPLYFYRKHIQNVWIISFGKKSYQELKTAEREAKGYEKKVLKTKILPK